MNVDRRSCLRCGLHTVCFVELCEECGLTSVAACETCVSETAGEALEVQARQHDRTCKAVTMPAASNMPSAVVRRVEGDLGRRLGRRLSVPFSEGLRRHTK